MFAMHATFKHFNKNRVNFSRGPIRIIFSHAEKCTFTASSVIEVLVNVRLLIIFFAVSGYSF